MKTTYDPRVGQTIARDRDILRGRTHVYGVAGSVTFEMQDVPAIARACADRGIVSAIDNTWATPLGFRPIEHGVDVVVHALTKYVGGHSDVMLGAVTARTRSIWNRLKHTAMDLGHGASPDDAWLALRGLRTLAARLDAQESPPALAAWLRGRPEVACCTRRSTATREPIFGGTSTSLRVFGVLLHEVDRLAIARMLEARRSSSWAAWGGSEPASPAP